MAGQKSIQNTEILEYALRHLEKDRDEIQARIDAIRTQLNPKQPESGQPRARRVLSDAARRRIAAAQKKRWAEHRKQQAKAAEI
jgi:uncharacterized protein YwgA